MKPLFEGKTVLVTGGSSGIGLELAKLFLKDRANVILSASQAPKLEEAAAALEKATGLRPRTLAADLGSPDAPETIFRKLEADKVDVLVNNAGFGLYGKFQGYDLSRAMKMIEVNVKAPVALTRLFLPGMVERGFGRVMNVASTAAFQAIPIESIYAASKAFVLLFSEAIADELEGTGVGVTCLCPGPTETPFFSGGVFPSKTIQSRMMTADAVAREGYRALEKNRTLVIAGAVNRAGAFSTRLAPRKIVTKLARRVVE